jgi:hypothetical protein
MKAETDVNILIFLKRQIEQAHQSLEPLERWEPSIAFDFLSPFVSISK